MGRLGHLRSSLPLKRELFPAGFAGQVMQHVFDTWKSFTMDRSVRLETRVTAVFREALIDAYVASGRSWFITLEDPVVDPNFGTEEGRNDLNFFPPQHYGQKIFFTVECKRLNVTRESSFKHLADAYVKDGMQRFVNEQYSKGLPCGGMVGYVMDGQLDSAFSQVKLEISRRTGTLKMKNSKTLQARSSTLPSCQHSLDTKHTRSDGDFSIHHVLVAVE